MSIFFYLKLKLTYTIYITSNDQYCYIIQCNLDIAYIIGEMENVCYIKVLHKVNKKSGFNPGDGVIQLTNGCV